jgi:hypothetical protein
MGGINNRRWALHSDNLKGGHMRKSKWLIISISLILTIGLANCGKKSSGLLLLPNLAQGEGGPQVSPEQPKGIEEFTSTQQQQPSIQVIDDVVAVDTGSLNNTTSPGEPAVIEIPNNQIPSGGDNSGGNNSGDNNTGDVKEVPNNQIPRGGDNSDDNGKGNVIEPKPIESEPQPVIITPEESKDLQEAIKNEDVTTDPIEQVVSSDTGSNDSAISEEETQEEIAAQEQEENEEVADTEEEDTTPAPTQEDKGKDDQQSCKAMVKEIDTSKGRWYNTAESLIPHPKQKNKFIKAKGIHTYWAYEKLLVKVNSNCEGGKYELVVVAKNLGKLPDWYHFFVVKVFNEKTGENLGTMLIRASDQRYHRGKLIVTLPKGDNILNVLWTNDAYEPNNYDANIQIKRIMIRKVVAKDKKQILTRKGSNFCDVNGRWFIGDNPPSAYTYWANQTVSYCLRTEKAGKYEVILRAGNAKNGLPLMPQYKEFKVLVAANGNSNYITIPAEQGKYHRGSTTLDLPAGDIVLNVTWLNDQYQPPEYDANIEIVRVRLIRVGDIESPIAAFLLQNPNVTYQVVIPGIILILGALGMIYWVRRQKLA